MRQELLALQRRLGITTIFVTHDQEEAMTTADRMAVMDQGIVQQVGTPANLFDYPCNRFVANFVGTMNMLEGPVQERSANMLQLHIDGVGLLKVPLVDEGSVPEQNRLAASFRPHTVQLESGNMNKGNDARYIWIPGTVIRSEFLGEFTRYEIQCGEKTIIADQSHYSGLPQHTVGAPISIGIEPTQIRLLPI